MPSKPPFEIHPGNFSLNVSGVAGFFGGDEAISAIQTIHHYKARRFLGWYNSPGSWNVGKKFGKLAKSRFWDGLFPGPDEEPAKFFELDGKQGPKYVASRSGSILEYTGHLAYLIMQKSKEELGYQVTGRVTKRNKVTVIKTHLVFESGAAKEETPKEGAGPPKETLEDEEEPHEETHEEEEKPHEETHEEEEKPHKYVHKEEELSKETHKEKDKQPVHDILPRSGLHTLVAILPIAVSFTTCALCGWTHDWFCFSMILLGIVSSGISSLVIGSACLKLQGVNSAPTAPPGDGMLMDGDDIVLLLGKEGDVATITRGKFVLEYDSWVRWRSRQEKRKRSVPGDGMKRRKPDRNSDAERGQNNSCPKQVATPQKQVAVPTNQGATSPKPSEEPVRDEYAAIGLCSLLLVVQLLAQLLLIPQGTLFGQIMFLSSFAASWAYNLYLSSIDHEYIQEELILKELHLKEEDMRTYSLGTRTTAAVFACLMLQPPGVCAESEWEDLGFKPERIICNFIPNDTPVWITWRKKVLDVMKTRDGSRDACHGLLKMSSEEERDFGAGKGKLLKNLLEDAKTAYDLAMEEQEWLKEN